MANLLPSKVRQRISQHAILRMASGVLLVGTVVGVASALLLGGAYVLADIEEQSLQYELDALAGERDEERAGGARIVADTRVRIAALETEHERSAQVSDATRAITNAVPAGIRITRLEYVRDPDRGTMRISGVFRDQEDLSAFADRLSSETLFSSVNVPISSFASTDNSSFTITASGMF